MIDSEDTNTTRRKPNKNKKTRFILPGDLEYKAPKTGVEPEWFNTKTNSVFIQVYASCMHATWLACMITTWVALRTCDVDKYHKLFFNVNIVVL
jgi:hypothetical protein